MATGLTSAGSFIALLDDTEHEVQKYALNKLDQYVDQFWPEIADALIRIEELHEDESFPEREQAALVASKVFYHLGAQTESMNFALDAGKLFTDTLASDSEYVTTLVAQCVDDYARRRREWVEKTSRNERLAEETGQKAEPVELKMDSRLENIVEEMFAVCIAEKNYTQVVGTAIESMRLDIVEKVLGECENDQELLEYCYKVCLDLVIDRDSRHKILELLVKLYKKAKEPDYMNMCRCLVFLDRAEEITDIFLTLLREEDEDKTLLVFQIAFELVSHATQHFRSQVKESLPAVKKVDGDEMDEGSEFGKNLEKLHYILSGKPTVKLFMEFLLRNNHTDLGILKKIKSLFEPRVSILHTATIVANTIMHCGTTKDTFLRNNLEWLSRAVAWAKFTTTAGLGVIHKGHLDDAFKVLDPYLPKPGTDASPYTEGGSLCALGLIHANHGTPQIIEYLLQQIRNLDFIYAQQNNNPSPGSLDPEKKKEIIQHGAALGLGLAAMGSGNDEVFEELKHLCFTPKAAVAGEACGIGMGLVMLGTATKKATEMLNFAHNTQHEKVIRSIGLGLGLIMYGLQEKADTMIESLCGDKDPVLRYGGQYCIGLAYCGTANNGAIRKLLHVAVSDVSDDVRRAAVLNLGFVLFNQPEQVPRLVSLLAVSYNPHVRYGAAFALGIACSGTGNEEAVSLLEPLTKDSVSFVRQGAYIAIAMVLIQSPGNKEKVKQLRESLLDIVASKHEPSISKFGAILGLGILDAGGRNQTISLSSKSGHRNLSAIVGLAIFTQYWYWYPFLNFISLAFQPTAIIGINKNLNMPNYHIKSNAKPSLFAYDEDIKAPKEEVLKALPTAQLSITKKQQKRDEQKKQENGTMDIEDDKEKKEEEEREEKEDKEKKEEEKPEPNFELLSNPARVTMQQLQYISFDVDPRYQPITKDVHGIVLLKDTRPDEEENIIQPGQAIEDNDTSNEPEPPSPFQFKG